MTIYSYIFINAIELFKTQRSRKDNRIDRTAITILYI